MDISLSQLLFIVLYQVRKQYGSMMPASIPIASGGGPSCAPTPTWNNPAYYHPGAPTAAGPGTIRFAGPHHPPTVAYANYQQQPVWTF